MRSVLTIAGSDSSGGAGIQADIKTIAAHGLFAQSVITSLTAQNTTGVYGVEDVSASFVRKQIDVVFDDIRPHAVKIGMVSSPEIVDAIACGLAENRAENIVVDPVMVATSGSALIAGGAVERLVERLFPLASVVTPNLDEARVLCGFDITSPEDVERAADAIAALCALASRRAGERFGLFGVSRAGDCSSLLNEQPAGERFGSPGSQPAGEHPDLLDAQLARGASRPEHPSFSEDNFQSKAFSAARFESVSAISSATPPAVLVKGGHGLGDEYVADDLLRLPDGRRVWLRGERVSTRNTHGTGCTLSSAIACELAEGFSMLDACARAKKYVTHALAAGLNLGKGSGPLDHMWAYRKN